MLTANAVNNALPAIGSQRTRLVTLSGISRSKTLDGLQDTLALLDLEGNTVIRMILSDEPFATNTKSQFANGIERARAILNGIGLRDPVSGTVVPEAAAGLDVQVLEVFEEYQGQGRWRGNWVAMPRELVTKEFTL